MAANIKIKSLNRIDVWKSIIKAKKISFKMKIPFSNDNNN